MRRFVSLPFRPQALMLPFITRFLAERRIAVEDKERHLESIDALLGNEDVSVDTYRESLHLLQKFPQSDPEVLVLMARCYHGVDERISALQAVRSVLKNDEHPAALDLFIDLCLEANDFEQLSDIRHFARSEGALSHAIEYICGTLLCASAGAVAEGGEGEAAKEILAGITAFGHALGADGTAKFLWGLLNEATLYASTISNQPIPESSRLKRQAESRRESIFRGCLVVLRILVSTDMPSFVNDSLLFEWDALVTLFFILVHLRRAAESFGIAQKIRSKYEGVKHLLNPLRTERYCRMLMQSLNDEASQNPKLAMANIARLCETYPERYEPWRILAMALFKINRVADAYVAAKKAVDIDPQGIGVQLIVANIVEKLNEEKSAKNAALIKQLTYHRALEGIELRRPNIDQNALKSENAEQGPRMMEEQVNETPEPFLAALSPEDERKAIELEPEEMRETRIKLAMMEAFATYSKPEGIQRVAQAGTLVAETPRRGKLDDFNGEPGPAPGHIWDGR